MMLAQTRSSCFCSPSTQGRQVRVYTLGHDFRPPRHRARAPSNPHAIALHRRAQAQPLAVRSPGRVPLRRVCAKQGSACKLHACGACVTCAGTCMQCIPMHAHHACVHFTCCHGTSHARGCVCTHAGGISDEDMDVAVFRFTLGIPGFEDRMVPRVVSYIGGAALVINHVISRVAESQVCVQRVSARA